jgi:arylsulfatase
MGKGGLMRISVGGREVARGRIENTGLMGIGLNETMDTGRDTGATMSTDYKGMGVFEGDIRKITVDLGPFGTSQPPAKTAAK